MSKLIPTTVAVILCCFLLPKNAAGHNGSIAYARPMGSITIDGKLNDWPQHAQRIPIESHLSDSRPVNPSDFSGFFQVGYNLENRSLYIAFSITDDNFIEDTTADVRWNTQDGLELCIDARHLLTGSGVASFMYSKKLRNTNLAFYDDFAKNASWELMEVAMTTNGNTRYYEWRINLGKELVAGKSIGLDFLVFDKDHDQSFSFAGWGKGGSKYMNPGSLGDVVLLPPDTKLSVATGTVSWDKPMKDPLPRAIRIRGTRDSKLWLQASIDSSGNYSASVPPGSYEVTLPSDYFTSGENVYAAGKQKPVLVVVKRNPKTTVAPIKIPGTPVPDLLPEKGLLLDDFTTGSISKVDNFIESYQSYFGIPGVSLALIKDGRVIYHKTYGVVNTMTGVSVDSSSLFEAASITKPVFSFAVLRLAERGVIDLDKPLWLYLPYPDIADDERYKLITARHVLTHRTGFPNWREGKLEIKFTPGERFGYSGEGFEYLKIVVEKITGKKVEQVLHEEVIQPMGLYHTFFSKNDSLQRMVAYGHFDRLPSNNNLPESPGMAYSMHTEAKIFTRFMLYMLEQKGLQPATYDTMFQKHSEFNFDPGDEKPRYPSYMGISLEIRETPYGKSFGHGGNNGDFKCKFEVYKDKKMGYVIFTNSNTADPLLENIRKFLVEGKD